jgi:hypothetical protein
MVVEVSSENEINFLYWSYGWVITFKPESVPKLILIWVKNLSFSETGV